LWLRASELRFRGLIFCAGTIPNFVLKFPVLCLWSIAYASELDPVDCAERPRPDFYIIINNYGELGPAFAETDLGEADLETTINDLMTGQYSDPGSHRGV